jgi:valyl-tRNA synthetase
MGTKDKKGKKDKPNPCQPASNKKKPEKAAKASTFVPDNTPFGEKKDCTKPMLPEYHPKSVEAAWYAWWEKKGFFKPDMDEVLKNPNAKKFMMVIPPPNVTGALHLGHALMLGIEDAITRWHRMSGHQTLWLPGCDHAGIATQSVVEKMIWKKERKTRHDYGREEFVKKVWEWKDEYGGKINNQFRRYGISVDWDRFAFTLDDTRATAVTEAFVRMYEKGLIYRDTRLVNWSCTLKTALSDLEVEHIELSGPTRLAVPGHDPNKKYEFGTLTHFAYKVKGSDETLTVATTRLETMLGDVAVAVHPNDDRYKHLVGKELEHPFIKDRKIVVITDETLVNMEFGTGAVKITPAHDPNDFQCGKRHGLEQINVFDEDGKINANGGPEFEGLPRFDARVKVYQSLEKLGLIKGKTPNPMRLGLCSKSNDIIEPYLKPQWYVDCKDMAARSVAAVRNGDLKIVPDSHEKTWYQWLENIQDWCVSRQLWWGHRIPVYLVKIAGVIDNPDGNKNEHWVVGRTEDEARANAAKKFNVDASKIELSQDEDVLDTWFSSGLFPFSTCGWPNTESDDMKGFFPGDLLETGHDILFFWVARMVMMSLELTDKLPFHTVFLHPMVRDEEGGKMSKSKGNVIDPLEVIDSCSLETLLQKLYDSNLAESEIKKTVVQKTKEFPNGIPECGTDALRFSLLSYMIQSNINLDVKRVVGYRNFCNKLWNINKFALSNFTEGFQPEATGV